MNRFVGVVGLASVLLLVGSLWGPGFEKRYAWAAEASGAESPKADVPEQKAASEAESAEATAPEKQVAKVVWDIKVRTTPQLFRAHLKDIREAYDEMVREEIEPDMVFLFRGPSVRLLRRKQPSWSKAAIREVAEMLAAFQKLKGVRMEADPVALESASKEARKLLPGIKPIKNGFVALIEYHGQGYATISLQ